MPRSSASTHSWKPKITRSSSGSDLVFSEITSRISDLSSALVRRRPEATHCRTALSHCALLKIKVMAGSNPSRSNFSITSARPKAFMVGVIWALSRQFFFPLFAPYLLRTLLRDSFSNLRISGFTLVFTVNRSKSLLPKSTC
ncbi:unannotated protein [freshwater metagenome]|uniref:Unannotated protein n=1 Tax=freshwater metagenome TaxID=449393 RepID=A0A6J6B8V3_9ZZZZ